MNLDLDPVLTFLTSGPVPYRVSMAVDDGWEGMTAADVKAYASSSATQSYGTVWNLKLSPSLILKVPRPTI